MLWSQCPLINIICCVCINLQSFGNASGNILRKTECSTSQREKDNATLFTLFPVSSNTVESVCLHLHTNVTFYLPKGCGRFYFLHSDALDEPFFPVWRQPYDAQWESQLKLDAFCLWSLLCVFLLLNCHWYSVNFVFEMELISCYKQCIVWKGWLEISEKALMDGFCFW